MRLFKVVTAVLLLGTTVLAADSPFAGTWKLNLAKSKDASGTASKEETITFEAVGDQWKRVSTGTDADGKPFNENSTIAWDGKDHPIENGMTVAVSTLSGHALKFTVKHEGKITIVGRAVVSKDGKTMTTYAKGTDDKGRKLDSVDVYDRQ
jgi:hypothetical protein